MDINFYKNKLIVFEGADLTGKTSVAQLLNKYINDRGIESIFTFQPGDDSYGTEAPIIRSLCKDKRYNLHPISNLFAFLLDRAEQTSKVVIPALQSGKTVISDRWWYSTIAYQFYGKELTKKYNLKLDFAYWMNEIASMNLEPDIIYYFPDKIKNHSRVDSPNDQFDNAGDEFKRRVIEGYEETFKNNGKVIHIHPKETAEATLRSLLESTEFVNSY
jgi:dTMP kinase